MSALSAISQPLASALKPIQSGPYTKAQFQHTIEGARNVKSTEEIEELLRDYPAALELYRTGKYKVKVKCEVDVERVILVEKRANKSKTEQQQQQQVTDEDVQQKNQMVPEEQNKDDQPTKEDRQAPKSSENIVHTASSSIRASRNAQSKVDQHRTSSKERAPSMTSSSRQQLPAPHSVNDAQKSHHVAREYSNRMGSAMSNQQNGWPQAAPRTFHPYWSNPLLQKGQGSNIYKPSPPQTNAFYQQGFFNVQQTRIPSLNQIQPSIYPMATSRSISNKTNFSLAPNHASSQYSFNGNNVPLSIPSSSSYRGFPSNQLQNSAKQQAMYQSQMSLTQNFPWSTMAPTPTGPFINPPAMYTGAAQTAQSRARSVDPNTRRQPPVLSALHPQPMPMMQQYGARPPTKNTDPPSAEKEKEAVQPNKDAISTNTDKLSIRQLHEIILQMNPTGRLPIQSYPELLQRFGMAVTVNELISAAQELQYNPNEPISARRLVHMLVKLGRLAKSAHPPRSSEAQESNDPNTTNLNNHC